jgi:VWFA-related protein
MRAPVWLALILLPLAHSADPPEVSIRSGVYSPPPTISAQSNLVESSVTVYDARGHATGGFTAADFTLFDNGKPQPITVFSELRSSTDRSPAAAAASAESPQVRNVALWFDDVHLSRAGLPVYRAAAEKLINHLQPGERLGIFTSSGSPTVDFTTDSAALLAALPQIKPQDNPGNRAMSVCPTMTPYAAYVIAEHIDEGEKRAAIAEVLGCRMCGGDPICAEGLVMDTAAAIWDSARHFSTGSLDVLKILVAHLAKQDGTRVLVTVSAGFIDDAGMKPEIKGILDAASRAHVTLNSLAVESSMGYRQLLMINTMSDAAAATGGRVIKNTNDLDVGLNTLATAPEVSYQLGFQAGEPDGKYHELKVALVNRGGFKIDSRPGYFATRAAPTVQQRIDNAVRSNAVLHDVPATVRIVPRIEPGGAYTVKVTIDIDAKHLRFATQASLHLQLITIVTTIEDAQGNFITGRQAVMDLRVKARTLASMQASGIHAVESFSLPKGAYEVREVVREVVQDRMAAWNTTLQLR